MGIEAGQLRRYVIRPTLVAIEPAIKWSLAAENLLMGTAAHESKLGRFVRQMGGGPARGLFQMEPETQADLYENFFLFQQARISASGAVYKSYPAPNPEALVWDMRYATWCARWQYYRAKPPLPDAEDVEGLARYWYEHWCRGCKGTVKQWMQDYSELVVD